MASVHLHGQCQKAEGDRGEWPSGRLPTVTSHYSSFGGSGSYVELVPDVGNTGEALLLLRVHV